MKAKYLFIIAAIAGLTTSCNMDLMPEGSLEESTAIQSLNDAMRFRNGFYTGMRSFCTSQFFSYADIQTDKFNGIVINGNRMGTIANGDVLPSDGDIAGYWASMYGLIANTNYFLTIMQPLYDKAVSDNDEYTIQEYERYIGEAHFFRGYYYAMMFDRWCQLYTSELGDKPGLGLPIVTVYDPTSDRTKYPGRSTMNETIKFFKDELQKAYEALSLYEETYPGIIEANAPYINSYTIRAMQARVELWLGNYKEAMDLALQVIKSGQYTLATTQNYANMWTKDVSSEVIFRPVMTAQELSNSIGSSWIGTQVTMADYLPTPQLLKSYEDGGVNPFTEVYNDVRFAAFISTRQLATAYGSIKSPVFNKFPGNTDLMVSSNPNLMNMPKPFRLSELYLIVAECAYNLNDPTNANLYLNTLRKNRIKSYKEVTLSDLSLREAIREERAKELVGEGFRLSDLRRWHLGFDRSSGNVYVDKPEVSMILTAAGLNVTYKVDDHRYTWPIPADELQSNPQMAGQQNPGY